MEERGTPRSSLQPGPVPVVMAVVALVAVAAFGLAGRGAVELTLDPAGLDSGSWLLALLAADAAWLLAATLVVARASPGGAVRPALRRTAIANLLLLALALVFVLQVEGVLPRVSPPPFVPFVAEGDPWTTHLDIPWLREVLLALLLLVGLAGAVVVARSLLLVGRIRRPGRGRLVRERQFGRGRRRAADPEAVLDAVRRARRALRSDDDVRRAVIGAYAAMEDAVAARGAERSAVQTPAEFLHAALDQGLLRSRTPAQRLLGLFEVARFSHEAMPADAAATADADLGVLQSDLERVVR